jgi:hypothetical protein
LVDNGDDVVIIIDQSNLNRWNPDKFVSCMDSMGFPVELETPVFIFEKISFCQSQPIFFPTEDSDWIMIRDIHKFCRNLLLEWRHNHTPDLLIRKMLCKTGMESIVNAGVPVLHGSIHIFDYLSKHYPDLVALDLTQLDPEFHRYFLELGVVSLDRLQEVRNTPILRETRESFFRAFDVTPGDQMLMEERFRTTLPSWDPSSIINYHSSWYFSEYPHDAVFSHNHIIHNVV